MFHSNLSLMRFTTVSAFHVKTFHVAKAILPSLKLTTKENKSMKSVWKAKAEVMVSPKSICLTAEDLIQVR